MLPSLSHLVSVQTHLDLSPTPASQEYILEGCPHPFTQTSVFNYSILNVSKTPVIELFFCYLDFLKYIFKGGSEGTLKELLQKETAGQYVGCQLPYSVTTGRSISTLNSASQSTTTARRLRGRNTYLFADFRATANILSASMKQLGRRDVMRTTQSSSSNIVTDRMIPPAPTTKDMH